jgi:hypothetical protein
VTTTAYSPERVAALGFCPRCHVERRPPKPVAPGAPVCIDHLRVMAGARPLVPGQVALVEVPSGAQAQPLYQRRRCTSCIAAGRSRPAWGEANRWPGDPRPLCIPCWRGEMDRSPAVDDDVVLSVEDRKALAALATDLEQPGAVEQPCEACACAGADRSAGAVRTRNNAKVAAGEGKAVERPCWRCGYEPDGYAWLADARGVHERDQAAAAALGERAGELAEVSRAARRAVRRVRARLVDVRRHARRLQDVLADVPVLTKTGPGGALEVQSEGGPWSRGVWLLAEFLAADAAVRDAFGMSPRGRPPVYPLVVALMAADGSREAGRRVMLGLDRAAWLAGVARRSVTTAFERTTELRWSVRVEQGGGCTLDERTETGRGNRRAVYDLRPLHLARFELAPHVGTAVALLARLLERALVLVDETRAELVAVQQEADEAAAAAADVAGLVEQARADDLAWQAECAAGELAAAWAADARQAQERADALRQEAGLRLAPQQGVPAVLGAAARAGKAADAAAWQMVAQAQLQAERLTIFCHPPRGLKGEEVTSGLRWFGVKRSPREKLTLTGGTGRPRRGRGEGQELTGSASRSSTSEVCPAQPVNRPRMQYGGGSTPHNERPGRKRRRQPQWSSWAVRLAESLMTRLAFLHVDAPKYGTEWKRWRSQVAAAIGPRLSAGWSAAEVEQVLEQYAGVHSLFGPGEAHSPLRSLVILLDRALTNPDARIPAHSPTRAQWRRAQAVAEHAEVTAGRAVLVAERDAAEAAGATERVSAQHGRALARQVAAAAAERGQRRADGRA